MKELAEASPSPMPREARAPSGACAAHLAAVLGASLFLVLLTRWPLLPPQLYSFDSVNLALALHEFDPTRNQPQPPGYPLFVLEARLLHVLLGTPERTFAVLALLISAICLALLYQLGNRLFSPAVGLAAAGLLLVNPVFWYSGLTSPLRPHLALISLLAAYCCWRAANGEHRYFYASSMVLGLGGGFRPELSLILLPLWAWAGWRGARFGVWVRGGLLLIATTALWVAILVLASGGVTPMIAAFRDYATAQTFQTSVAFGSVSLGWRRMLGRAFVWTALGALPWLWALPFAWFRRQQWPHTTRSLGFLTAWFLPGFLFHCLIHIGDPDHALTTIPAVCLVGGLAMIAAEQTIRLRVAWTLAGPGLATGLALLSALIFLSPRQEHPLAGVVVWIAIGFSLLWLVPLVPLQERAPVVCAALLANILLFLGHFPFPQGPAASPFHGLASVRDAFLGGRYESSYDRVRWTAQMMDVAVEHLPLLKLSAHQPVLLIWSRDGEPVWRKLAYYFPTDRLYVLDEAGDPGVPSSQARLWSGNNILRTFSGVAPVPLPVPRGSRLVWFVGGGSIRDLAEKVPLQRSPVLLYSDLPADSPSFRWGSFEFVPE